MIILETGPDQEGILERAFSKRDATRWGEI